MRFSALRRRQEPALTRLVVLVDYEDVEHERVELEQDVAEICDVEVGPVGEHRAHQALEPEAQAVEVLVGVVLGLGEHPHQCFRNARSPGGTLHAGARVVRRPRCDLATVHVGYETSTA